MTERRTAGATGRLLIAMLAVAIVGQIRPSLQLDAFEAQSADLPELTQPVNDFAHVIDPQSAAEIDRTIRTLKTATGDVVVVATVPTIGPFGDIREYANKLFENHGRGLGDRGKDNGLLILLAVQERGVRVEVGYGLEEWITDGFAGETSREYMVPEFRNGRYGAGLLSGTTRIVARIAQGRNVSLQGVVAPPERQRQSTPVPLSFVIFVFIVILVLSRMGGGPGARRNQWGGGPWSGWSSGVGPFGGGGGGGFGGGGFGGGFGGFGGGRSGGGGGGGSW